MTGQTCGLLHAAHEDDRTFEMADYQGPVARWCSGCGDHSVLAASQRLLAEMSSSRGSVARADSLTT